MKKTEIYKQAKKLNIDFKKVDLILEKITGFNKNQLFLSDNIDDKFKNDLEKIFSRIVKKEPLEYILEKAEFFGFEFYVDSRVLIPRNDTEIMVEKVFETSPLTPLLQGEGNNLVLIDIGTGSACIPISIIKTLELNNCSSSLKRVFAIDISKDALDVAEINIKKHNLENKIKLINSNLLEVFELDTSILSPSGVLNLGNIIITANLPYIKNGDYKNMDNSTIKFEPDLALYGGEKTGFELYEKLIYQIFELQSIYNIKSLILFIEIGFDQKEIAIKFLEKLNLKFEIFKDNSGIDRCVKIIF